MPPVALIRGIALATLFLLAACATPAEPERMAVSPAANDRAFPPRLAASLCVRTITGGEETNPLWVSQVGNGEFRQALEASLRNHGLLAGSSTCHYSLDANLLGMSHPIMGFDLDVGSNINYKVQNAANTPFLLETVSATYTATFSESPVAIIRLKRGNEGSIRANITTFLQRLRESTPN